MQGHICVHWFKQLLPARLSSIPGIEAGDVLHTWFKGVLSAMLCDGWGVAAGRSGKLPTAVGRTTRLVVYQIAIRPAPCVCSWVGLLC